MTAQCFLDCLRPKQYGEAIILTPEHERIIRAQLVTGQFRSVEEVLDKGPRAFNTQSAVTAREHTTIISRM